MTKKLTEEQKIKARIAQKKWRTKPENLKKLAAYKLTRRKRNPEVRMFDCAKYRAKQAGLEFNISIDDIKIPNTCPILLIPLVFGKERRRKNSPTLDRIDSSKGYIKGNVAVLSHKANSAKSDLTIEQVKRMLAYMEGKID